MKHNRGIPRRRRRGRGRTNNKSKNNHTTTTSSERQQLLLEEDEDKDNNSSSSSSFSDHPRENNNNDVDDDSDDNKKRKDQQTRACHRNEERNDDNNGNNVKNHATIHKSAKESRNKIIVHDNNNNNNNNSRRRRACSGKSSNKEEEGEGAGDSNDNNDEYDDDDYGESCEKRMRKPLLIHKEEESQLQQGEPIVSSSVTPHLLLSYRVAKWSILRLLGMVYWFAFLGAWFQTDGLMGPNGLAPAHAYLTHLVQRQYPVSPWQGFIHYPMIFWWIPYSRNVLQYGVILPGFIVSTLVAFAGSNSWLLQVLLWLLDFSIVTLASGSSSFYGYGWESQLLETGFLAIFLCDLPSLYCVEDTDTETETETKSDNDDAGVTRNKNCWYWWWRKVWTIRLDLALWETKPAQPKRKKSGSLASSPSSTTEHVSVSNKNDATNIIKLKNDEPSSIILWLFRWLCFRISMGAGLIKLRGSSCWTKRTCLHYHFETQPIPSPLSFVYHFLPKAIQSHMVDVDLVVQVYTSALVLIPVEWFAALAVYVTGGGGQPSSNTIYSNVAMMMFWTARSILRLAGFLQAGFMVGILLSGNFAFLNHLTIIPALACFDDDSFSPTIRNWTVGGYDDVDNNSRSASSISPNASAAATVTSPEVPGPFVETDKMAAVASATPTTPTTEAGTRTIRLTTPWYYRPRRWLDVAFLGWILHLSRPVIQNLWSPSQQMNASFDPFRLVNTYGAFGSVGEARYEPIIRVSSDDDDDDNGTSWYELDLPCKPGTVHRRPCFCAPYHYRLDWNIWFIGFKPHRQYLTRRETWMFALLQKILEPPASPSHNQSAVDDKGILGLLPTRLLQRSEERPWLDLLDATTADYLQSHYYDKGKAPRYVKVEMYHYEMADSLWKILLKTLSERWSRKSLARNDKNKIVWWNRTFEETLIRTLEWDHDHGEMRIAPLAQ